MSNVSLLEEYIAKSGYGYTNLFSSPKIAVADLNEKSDFEKLIDALAKNPEKYKDTYSLMTKKLVNRIKSLNIDSDWKDCGIPNPYFKEYRECIEEFLHEKSRNYIRLNLGTSTDILEQTEKALEYYETKHKEQKKKKSK